MQCCCEQCSCNGKVCARGMGKLCSAVWWDTIEWAQCFAIWKDTKILQEIIIPLVMHGCDHKNYFSQRKTIADNSRTAKLVQVFITMARFLVMEPSSLLV